jgi:ABC-type transport system involved in multi-copper enzyme maturation permease subunit
MTGMIIKDFINLRNNIKILLIFIAVYGVMSFAMQDSSLFSTVFTIVCAILTLNLYSYDEVAKWDSFALTMPVSKEAMVQEKYIMMLLLTLSGVVLGTVFSVLIYLTSGIGVPLDNIRGCILGAAAAIIFYSIAIPVITKTGVEKARFVLIAVYAIPFAAVVFIGKAIKDKTLVLPEQVIDLALYFWKNAYIFITVVLLVVLAISYVISIRIYRKKEF